MVIILGFKSLSLKAVIKQGQLLSLLNFQVNAELLHYLQTIYANPMFHDFYILILVLH